MESFKRRFHCLTKQNEKHHKRTSFRRIPSSHNPMESSKRGYRVDTMLVISFTSRLRTAIVSSIIVFGHATAHAMHTCKSERAHPSAIIFHASFLSNIEKLCVNGTLVQLLARRIVVLKSSALCIFSIFALRTITQLHRYLSIYFKPLKQSTKASAKHL